MNSVNDIDQLADGSSQELTAEEVSQVDETSRKKMRNTIACEMEQFLKNGGSITQVEAHTMADPPTKPKSGYGKGAI
jgi:hypothetical protein